MSSDGIDRIVGDAPGIGAAITRIAAFRPDDLALVCGMSRLSWRELDLLSTRLARALASRGVSAGDIVTLVLPNRVETIALAVASWKIGATPMPLSARMPVLERSAILALSRPRLHVAESADEGALVLDALLADVDRWSDAPLAEVATRPWKAITSGGSTGRPKVILAFDDGPRGARHRALFRTRERGVSLIGGPLYFNGPFSRSAMTLLAGSTLVLMERFDAEAYLAAIERERVTWSLTVPTMWQRIFELPEDVRRRYDLSTLETMLHSGSPMPVWLKRAVIDLLGPDRVLELYGATEVAGTMIDGREWLTHPGSVGRAIDGYRIEIRSEDGTVLPPDVVGEIWIRPPSAPTFRYLGAEPRVAGGWVSVGDLGQLDADGYLFIADRRTDLILTGGSNVYPAEVEAALLEHSGVRDAVVIGLPDERWGSRVHAIVEARDQRARPVDLDEFVRARLTAYKVPKTYEFVEQIPRDASGKVRRQALRDERAAAADASGRATR